MVVVVVVVVGEVGVTPSPHAAVIAVRRIAKNAGAHVKPGACRMSSLQHGVHWRVDTG